MTFGFRDPRTLRPHPRNARKHPRRQIDAIRESIRRWGFRFPVAIDSQDQIIAGHARAEAAALEGLEAVPIVQHDDLTDEQVQALMLLDNQLAGMSTWDEKALAAEVQSLADIGIDLTAFDLAVPTTPEAKATAVQIEDASIDAAFWIACEGPIDQQPAVLDVLKALAKLPGVTVHSNVKATA